MGNIEEKTEKRKQYMKEYRERNKDRLIQYRKANEEILSENSKRWAKNNPDKIRISTKKWKDENPEQLKINYNESVKKRRLTDPLFRLKCNARSMMSKVIRRNGYSKNSKTQDILGCSFEEFKEHIESQWNDWMSWDNYGKYNGEEGYGWDIDHIIPVSSAINESNIIELNHYNNLQPLCSKINRDIKKDELSMDF